MINVHEVKVHQRGPDRTIDIKIEVDGKITVNEGHDIASLVKKSLIESDLRVTDVYGTC